MSRVMEIEHHDPRKPIMSTKAILYFFVVARSSFPVQIFFAFFVCIKMILKRGKKDCFRMLAVLAAHHAPCPHERSIPARMESGTAWHSGMQFGVRSLGRKVLTAIFFVHPVALMKSRPIPDLYCRSGAPLALRDWIKQSSQGLLSWLR